MTIFDLINKKMKLSIISFFVLLLTPCLAYSQVFNSGARLNDGVLSLGFEPVFIDASGAGSAKFFIHGDLKLSENVSINGRIATINSTWYAGGFKWKLAKYIAFNTGFHKYQYAGADASIIAALPLGKGNHLYTGLDARMEFPTNDVLFPVLVPLGISVDIAEGIAIALEGEIPITYYASFIFGGGLIIFFK